MSGTVKEANLRTRTARVRLRRGREPSWHTLLPGRAHLGWQRWPGPAAGRWVLRQYVEGRYRTTPLGPADDIEGSGLSFERAEAGARAILDAPVAAAARLTVRQAMQDYIEQMGDDGRPTRDLVSRTQAWILPTLGDLVVSDLTTERLRRWRTMMAKMPAMKRTRSGEQQAYKAEPITEEAIRRRRASANRVLTMLKAALNRAFKNGRVTSDLAWRRVEPFRAVEEARVRYLSVAEAKRLINAADPDFRPLVEAALQTGCRYGELVALQVADFNPDAGTVHIRKSKSGKARHVVLTDEGSQFFRRLCAGRLGGDTLFLRADGGPWKEAQQQRPMLDACERAKIKPPIGIHQLRHTWASLAVMAGVPLVVVARNLGHVDTRMVEKFYGHLEDTYIAAAIRAGAPRFGTTDTKGIVPIR